MAAVAARQKLLAGLLRTLFVNVGDNDLATGGSQGFANPEADALRTPVTTATLSLRLCMGALLKRISIAHQSCRAAVYYIGFH
jgi:hypothetical protein